jgi:hypothetical protein
LREQKIPDIKELELCIRTQESCPGFRRFEFFQISDATDNFSESRNIGRGGFATVYKVIIKQKGTNEVNAYLPCFSKVALFLY